MTIVDSRLESESSGPESNSGKKVAFGQISFINALPVVLPLQESRISIDAELVFANPAQLNKKLKDGELLLGAMSSFYFLEDGGFDLFSDISISGSGQVGSVLLFAKDELKDLDGKLVTVPDSSATSIKLMQSLLLEELGVRPRLVLDSEHEAKMSTTEVRACLVIGDKALAFDHTEGKQFQKTDLAQWWYRYYQLPFVFGVWGARKQWVAENKALFASISRSLSEARILGLGQMLEQVITEANARTKLSRERLRSYYLDDLNYLLTDKHMDALKLFKDLCIKHKLLNEF